ncbi:hypothetical protein [Alicyclobacillus dauci]|uniref:Uncharacterized protein n=1 Tax=Alicyclobacillus dauci TaxID=1475485 RepID=A0ABY6Z448_9BACL|nr:hypothetical protein [Alicyclobacillus dauci]WAH36971.1 hypothetical protein NZD86_22900 [Alicyclobacillus dauci]
MFQLSVRQRGTPGERVNPYPRQPINAFLDVWLDPPKGETLVVKAVVNLFDVGHMEFSQDIVARILADTMTTSTYHPPYFRDFDCHRAYPGASFPFLGSSAI